MKSLFKTGTKLGAQFFNTSSNTSQLFSRLHQNVFGNGNFSSVGILKESGEIPGRHKDGIAKESSQADRGEPGAVPAEKQLKRLQEELRNHGKREETEKTFYTSIYNEADWHTSKTTLLNRIEKFNGSKKFSTDSKKAERLPESGDLVNETKRILKLESTPTDQNIPAKKNTPNNAVDTLSPAQSFQSKNTLHLGEAPEGYTRGNRRFLSALTEKKGNPTEQIIQTYQARHNGTMPENGELYGKKTQIESTQTERERVLKNFTNQDTATAIVKK